MTLEHVYILFQLVVFLSAISIHEWVPAWMANLCGDPITPMLGWIDVVPVVFKLIPVPPLDESLALKHFLPDSTRRSYDPAGLFGLQALVSLGGNLLGRLIDPSIGLFNSILLMGV